MAIRVGSPIVRNIGPNVQISDGITPVLRSMLKRIHRSRELMLVLGRAGEKELRSHFARKDKKKGKHPGKKTHFWARLRKLTALDGARTTAKEAVIATADRALAGPVFGPKGVKAKPPNKMLAIPIHADSVGKRARSGLIKGLELILRKRGAFLGVKSSKTAKAKLGKPGGSYSKTIFYYILVASVDIPRDPTALPPAGRFQEALAKGLHLFCRTTFGAKIYRQLKAS